MEGYPTETKFSIRFVNGYLNENTIIYIHYPLYYAPGLTNIRGSISCLVNSDKIPCSPDLNYPFRLTIHSSPITLNRNDIFTLSV
jgi:hypothetical protein